MLIILVLMALLAIGVRQSAHVNAAAVFIKLLTIVVFVTVAIFHVDTANWHPFVPFGWSGTDEEGNLVGIMAGASMVFFAYVGFDAVSTAVEEARNPKRDVPIGIVASLLFCTIIYIVVSGLLTGIVPYTQLNVSSPVAHSLNLIGVDWASALVATGVVAGLTTVMLVLYYGLTRVFFAMSRDGLLPEFFGAVNAHTQTPVRVIVFIGVVVASVAGLVPLKELAELVNIGTLAAFVLVCFGVIVLRIRQPHLHRPFKNPLNPIFPVGHDLLWCTNVFSAPTNLEAFWGVAGIGAAHLFWLFIQAQCPRETTGLIDKHYNMDKMKEFMKLAVDRGLAE